MNARAVSSLLLVLSLCSARPQAALAGSADAELAAAAKQALVSAPQLSPLLIRVDVAHGRVTLQGRVVNRTQKADAERIVRGIDGVTGVENLLWVDRAAARTGTRQEQSEVRLDDHELAKVIERKLAARPELETSRIRVVVRRGIARLRGSVPSQTARLSAITTAQRVPGIRATTDKLKIVESLETSGRRRRMGLEASADPGERPPSDQLYPSDEGSGNDAGDVPLHD